MNFRHLLYPKLYMIALLVSLSVSGLFSRDLLIKVENEDYLDLISQDISYYTGVSADSITIRPYAHSAVLDALQRRIESADQNDKLLDNKLSSSVELRKSRLKEEGLQALKSLRITYRVNLPKNLGIDFSLIASKLSNLSYIKYAELSEEVFIPQSEPISQDPLVGDQYYLEMVMAPEAWALLDSLEAAGEISKEKVTVAVVDTGYDLDHEDLVGVFGNKGEQGIDQSGKRKDMNGIDDDGNGYVDDWMGWDFNSGQSEDGDADPSGGHKHGMHVAGTIAANRDNGIGIAGISNRVTILPVKIGVDDPNDRSINNAYSGLLYAGASGATIVNCSWGGPSPSQTGLEVVNTVRAAGTLIIAAAGNNNRDERFYPAAYDGVISVGAVESKGRKPGFSNYHHSVDIAAPGLSIEATIPGNRYDRMSGTSMASPMVAGIAAMSHIANPEYDSEIIGQIICNNVSFHTDSLWPQYTDKLGRGIGNAEQAIRVSNRRLLTIDDLAVGGEKGKLQAGDTALVSFTAISHLDQIEDIDFSVQGEWGILSSPPYYHGSIGGNSILENTGGLWVAIEEESWDYTSELLVSAYSEGQKIAHQAIPITVNPTFDSYGNDALSISSNSQGNLAYNDFPYNQQGVGLQVNGRHTLFESGIILSLDSIRTINNLRGDFAGSKDQDFDIVELMYIDTLDNGTVKVISKFKDRWGSKEEPSIEATDSFAIGVTITQTNIIPPGDKPFIITIYDIENPEDYKNSQWSDRKLEDLYFATFHDWDVSENARSDFAYWDFSDGSITFKDMSGLDFSDRYSKSKGEVYVWQLSGQQKGCFMIDNGGGEGEFSPSIYDGFTRKEKHMIASGGLSRLESELGDVSVALSSGPLYMNSGDRVKIIQAIAYSEEGGRNSKSALRAEIETFIAENADLVYGKSEGPKSPLISVFPNPVENSSTVLIELREHGTVDLSIYDHSGRIISTIESGKFYGLGKYRFSLPTMAAGAYRLVLQSGEYRVSEMIVYE